ncbi:MAG: endonuclease/exonuclease/phosphatase family protein [Candidatus Curtissbacteria bacterium]
MKLVSLNVALFENNNIKLEDFLRSQNADILSLQEVTKRIDESVNLDLISKDTIDNFSIQLQNSFFAPVWILSKFEKANFHGKKHFLFDLGGKAEFGNYIRTKFHISKGQNIFVQNHFTYVTDWSNWPEEDYRAVQVVDLNIGGGKLRLLNYHGIWSKDKKGTEKTKEACRTIKKLALEINYPAIITGDFNLFPNTESISVFRPELKSLVDEYNIKSTRPSTNELSDMNRNVVDYIFVTEGIKINTFEVLQNNVSDHLPLVMDFEIL